VPMNLTCNLPNVLWMSLGISRWILLISRHQIPTSWDDFIILTWEELTNVGAHKQTSKCNLLWIIFEVAVINNVIKTIHCSIIIRNILSVVIISVIFWSWLSVILEITAVHLD
jgi:hypothetical protein